jgi:hypothetical protein
MRGEYREAKHERVANKSVSGSKGAVAFESPTFHDLECGNGYHEVTDVYLHWL